MAGRGFPVLLAFFLALVACSGAYQPLLLQAKQRARILQLASVYGQPAENLYAQNYAIKITEYAQGSKSPSRHVGAPGGATMAFDHKGDLYVGYGGIPGSTIEYPPGSNKPLRTIMSRSPYHPVHFAFDSADNVYIGNATVGYVDFIAVYPPKGQTALREMREGAVEMLRMAVDSSGTLYVANWQSLNDPACVTMYAPGSPKVLHRIILANPSPVAVYNSNRQLVRTIRKGIFSPVDLVLDRSDNLYVANGSNHTGWISVYARDAKVPSYEIHKGLEDPNKLLVDPH